MHVFSACYNYRTQCHGLNCEYIKILYALLLGYYYKKSLGTGVDFTWRLLL